MGALEEAVVAVVVLFVVGAILAGIMKLVEWLKRKPIEVLYARAAQGDLFAAKALENIYRVRQMWGEFLTFDREYSRDY